MIEWLLKEEKAKVGRPKLADSEVVNKAKKILVISFISCALLIFGFICSYQNVSPLTYLHHLTLERYTGSIYNNAGFNIKEYYNNDNDLIIDFKLGELSKKANYKYEIYKLVNNEWKKYETKSINSSKNFKIKFESLKNKNQTFKVNLYVSSSSNIDKSYIPFSWELINTASNKKLAAYKVFTVKGYYSPVSLSEEKNATKNPNSISVLTDKNKPRSFKLDLKGGKYKVIVKYTDDTGKKVVLSNSVVNDKKVYTIPKVNKLSEVTFTIYGDDVTSKSLDNWTTGSGYIENTYLLKPEGSYK